MKLDLYQIDAFAEHPFEGNPAAVCPLKEWLDESVMQSIALENNLSETAFFIPYEDDFYIRWFTPLSEVDLCGHATLASAYVLFDILGYSKSRVRFNSRSGWLSVEKTGQELTLDFPSQPPVLCEMPVGISDAFTVKPSHCYRSEDYIFIFEREDDVSTLEPNMEILKSFDLRGVIVTAASENFDFITRFFAPKFGVNEDPVTGSAFTQLGPLWAERLGKTDLRARQVSYRGGNVKCRIDNDRVLISGQAIKFLEGKITI